MEYNIYMLLCMIKSSYRQLNRHDALFLQVIEMATCENCGSTDVIRGGWRYNSSEGYGKNRLYAPDQLLNETHKDLPGGNISGILWGIELTKNRLYLVVCGFGKISR